MEFHGRKVFDILEKPLGLATKFIFSLADGKLFEPRDGSHGAHYKPSPSTHSPITSNPLIPACLLLLIGFMVVTLSPVRVWLTEVDDLPTLANIFSFSRNQKAPSLPSTSEGVSVWAKKQSGFYYCQGGTLFGDKPGVMMTQIGALTSGYRPADRTFCTNNQPVVASADGSSFGSQQSSQTEDTSALAAENQPETPVASEDVRVWGLKQLGFYYCRGDALFGVKPGQLMRQAEARSAGLLPSYHTCSGSTANLASAGDLSSGIEQALGPANTSPPSMERATLPTEEAVKTSQAGARVTVWVKKQFGFYYCHNDVLFGNRPGQLMSQADALTAGYQPSDGSCSNSKQIQTSAERLSPRGFPGKH
jgi:guanyl-specific ribonuclease Sa